MLVAGVNGHAQDGTRRGAHVVVCGNEKGGTGKSTLAMHLAVALLQAGHRVATFDLDGRQATLSRYVENRRRRVSEAGGDVAVPRHFQVSPSRRETRAESEGEAFRLFSESLTDIDRDCDFVVVDTPGADTFLNRLAHRIADTLVTPVNDSLVDLDVLARIDPADGRVLSIAPYATAVTQARKERRRTDGTVIDWIVMRNRLARPLEAGEAGIERCLGELAAQLGFRLADGISERPAFRAFFPLGLTALDGPDHVGSRPTLSDLAARQEVRQLVGALRLPLGGAGRRGDVPDAPEPTVVEIADVVVG